MPNFRIACHIYTWEDLSNNVVEPIFRQIAEAIATGLGVPSMSLSEEEARAHFGWFFPFATIDQTASGDRTRARLGWQPGGPDLLTDLRSAGYFEVPVV